MKKINGFFLPTADEVNAAAAMMRRLQDAHLTDTATHSAFVSCFFCVTSGSFVYEIIDEPARAHIVQDDTFVRVTRFCGDPDFPGDTIAVIANIALCINRQP